MKVPVNITKQVSIFGHVSTFGLMPNSVNNIAKTPEYSY
jgi:hypothetical protein